MSVISFKETHDGRGASAAITSKEQSRSERTRSFRAITNSIYDGPDAVANWMHTNNPGSDSSPITLGAAHPTLAQAFCQKIDIKNFPKSKVVFLVTVTYSTDPIVASGSPANDPAEITWNTEQFSRRFEYDFSSPARGITNSAGVPFDTPPTDSDCFWVATVKKNVSFLPSWILNYRNSINRTPFMLDSVLVGTFCGWMKAISIGRVNYRDTATGQVAYRPLQLTIACKSGNQLRSVTGGPTPWGTPCGPISDDWQTYLLDEGRLATQSNSSLPNYGSTLPIANADGTASRDKKPLDGTGNVLASPSPSNVVFIPYLLKQVQEFNLLPLT
jgi:hypothetical protein